MNQNAHKTPHTHNYEIIYMKWFAFCRCRLLAGSRITLHQTNLFRTHTPTHRHTPDSAQKNNSIAEQANKICWNAYDIVWVEDLTQRQLPHNLSGVYSRISYMHIVIVRGAAVCCRCWPSILVGWTWTHRTLPKISQQQQQQQIVSHCRWFGICCISSRLNRQICDGAYFATISMKIEMTRLPALTRHILPSMLCCCCLLASYGHQPGEGHSSLLSVWNTNSVPSVFETQTHTITITLSSWLTLNPFNHLKAAVCGSNCHAKFVYANPGRKKKKKIWETTVMRSSHNCLIAAVGSIFIPSI